MRILILSAALVSLAASAGTPERPFVPQVPDAWETFRGLAEDAVSLPATTVVLCQVSVPSLRYDSFAGAELRVSLSVNGGPPGLVNGPEDADVALVSFPVTLSRGDRLTMTVWDRDFTELEFVGSGSVVLGASLPVSFTKSPFKATCRGLPEAMTLTRQETTIARVDAALDALTPQPLVQLVAENLGRPDRERRELDEALNAAGAWQSWNRPALAERLRRSHTIEARWTRAVTDQIATQLTQLPKAGEPIVLQAGVLDVTVGALRCVHGRCSLTLEFTNLSEQPLERDRFEVPEEAFDRAQVFCATGNILEVSLPGAPASPDGGTLVSIAPGARAVVKATTWFDPQNGAPRLLRLRTPFGWKVLRLREP